MEDIKENNLLASLLQHSNDVIVCLSENFKVTELNVHAEKFYNWQYKEYHGQNFLDLCKSHGYTCPIDLNYFINPTPLKISLNSKHASGEQSNVNWIICPIVLSDKITHGVVLIGEIIELKKSNIAYHLNEIINCVPGCLYWKDRNGRYLGCNNLTAELAGLTSVQEIVGKTDEELWGEQANFLTGNDQQVLSGGKAIKVEEKLQASDGRWLDFTGVKMPLRDENNNIIGIIGNSLDITELKKTQTELKKAKEKAESLSSAKSEFIANMSHDVKTPLSGIIGLSEILSHALMDENADLAQNIFLAGQQLMNFFNNCLDIAKSENTDIVLFKERFNLKLLFNEIVDIFQPAAQSKNLDFYFYYDEKRYCRKV